VLFSHRRRPRLSCEQRVAGLGGGRQALHELPRAIRIGIARHHVVDHLGLRQHPERNALRIEPPQPPHVDGRPFQQCL